MSHNWLPTCSGDFAFFQTCPIAAHRPHAAWQSRHCGLPLPCTIMAVARPLSTNRRSERYQPHRGTAQCQLIVMADTFMDFDTLARHGAVNREKYAAVFFVLIKEF